MLWRDLKVWQIFGANTDVGKSVVSTLLCKALTLRARPSQVLYLKPVSTGSAEDHDHTRIGRVLDSIVSKGIVQYAEAKSPHIAARGQVSSLRATPVINLIPSRPSKTAS
jgi:bifunctional dethiobiotin synthetase / adenosylmethionine---8-amino-7-oxononanoate aminotransferase